MILVQDTEYTADIELGFFEKYASNDTIASKLVDAGFRMVVVTGSGSARKARGVWVGATQDAEVPSQLKNIRQV